jgi:hypothetical protein
MAITQAMCTSFKAELLLGVHDFRPSADTGADVFKLALYTSSASLDIQLQTKCRLLVLTIRQVVRL